MYYSYNIFLFVMIVMVIIVCAAALIYYIYHRPPKVLNKFYETPLKVRKNLARVLLLIGCIGGGIYFWNSISVKKFPTSIKISAKKMQVPQREDMEKKFRDTNQDTKPNAVYKKQLKKFYHVLCTQKDTKGDSGGIEEFENQLDIWSEGERQNMVTIDAASLAVENVEKLEIWDDSLRKILEKNKNDYEEAYDQLSTKAKQQIKNMDWKIKNGVLYAVNRKGEYLYGTAQLLHYEDRAFVKAMENAGFSGIRQWLKRCNEKSKGITIKTTDGKQHLLHNTNQSYRFESQGITFIYNYQCLIMELDYEKLTGFKDESKKLPRDSTLMWKVKKAYPGGSYSQVDLQSDGFDQWYCQKNMKVLLKGDKIRQMTIHSELQVEKIEEDGTVIRQDGFYEKEKAYVIKCLKNMGVSEEIAQKWLDDFKFNQTKTEGTVGNCNYQLIQDAKERVYDFYPNVPTYKLVITTEN